MSYSNHRIIIDAHFCQRRESALSQFSIDYSDLFNNSVILSPKTGELSIGNSRMIYAITRSFITGNHLTYLLSVKFSDNGSIRKPWRAYTKRRLGIRQCLPYGKYTRLEVSEAMIP